MIQTGPEILNSLRSLKKFLGSIRQLLGAGESLMQESGWSQFGGNIAYSETSRSFHEPDLWIPFFVCRFFRKNSEPNLLSFVTVILDDPDAPERIVEPLVSSGYLNYGSGETIGAIYNITDGYIALLPDKIPTEMSDIPLDLIPSASGKRILVAARALAVPLADVVDTETLKKKVIEPLLMATK